MCYGECPKHRFIVNEDKGNIAYLCKGYKMFFEKALPYFGEMQRLILSGRPASDIVQLFSDK